MKISKKTTGVAAAFALALGAAATGTPALASTHTASESAQLQALYAKAKAQGGEVTVYMGGDKPGQWDWLGEAFAKQFPGIKIHIVTDLSKIHDARIDNQ